MRNSVKLFAGVLVMIVGILVFVWMVKNSFGDNRRRGALGVEHYWKLPINLTAGRKGIYKKPPFILPPSINKANDISEFTVYGTTLITGFLNKESYHTAHYLHNTNHQVLVVEDEVAPDFNVNKEGRTASEQVSLDKIPFEHIDFANMKKLSKTIQETKNTLQTVLYFLPDSLNGETTSDKINGISNFRVLLEHFVILLESLYLDSLRQVTILATTPTNSLTHTAIIDLFSLVLQSYQSTHSFGASLVYLEEDHIDNQCDNIDNLIKIIFSTTAVLNTAKERLHQERFQCSSTGKEKAAIKKHNVLFSTYFTKNKQFVRPYRENSFQFVKGFVVTAKRYNAHIVIYYDQIDQDYKDRLLEFYDNIEFTRYTGNFHHRTINDARFYIMYEYLKDHPEIDRIILQDLRDGIYLNDPFKVMELAGDLLFVGKDLPFWTHFVDYYRFCEAKMKEKYGSTRYYPMLNAGTLGGTRHVVMAFLEKIMFAFNEVFPSRLNCNMDAFDFVSHHFFKDLMYYGYPFQGFMQVGLSSPPGIAIRHKRTRYDM